MEADLMQRLVSLMLPCPDEIQIETLMLDPDHNQVILGVTAIQVSPACPRCQLPSDRVHSRYRRRLVDLPWAGIGVSLHLEVRKCICANPTCTQHIFTERLPALAAPWARRTQRLAEQQRSIGLALGGAPSQRLSGHLDCPASRDTFLRLVRMTPTAETPKPRCVGVDDWAMRKGHTYGSIVVDLERSAILDVLSDRTAETFARWLHEHPGVEVISRDRSGTYAEGAATGAPNAVQVADRWHLLRNLDDALVSLFDQHRSAIEQHLRPSPPEAKDSAAACTEAEQSLEPFTPLSGSVQLPNRQLHLPVRRRERRLARYEKVCQLREQGWTISAIADEVDMDRATVRKYLQAPAFPERQPRPPRTGLLDPFKPYILHRWNAGCHTGSLLLREIKSRGYQGGATTCLAYITQLRRASGLPPKKRTGVQTAAIAEPTQRVPSMRELAWLVLRKADTLAEVEQQRLIRLSGVHTDITAGITLSQEFATLIRERQPEQLDSWLARAEQGGIASLVSFAKGIRRDYAAVKAGVTLHFSNGPTEGHINRLKTLKRQMFGRAKLDLLKVRLMAVRSNPEHSVTKCAQDPFLYRNLQHSRINPQIPHHRVETALRFGPRPQPAPPRPSRGSCVSA